MFDDWTDKYKRLPYLGLRIAYVIKEWIYRIITVFVKVLEKHTGENMAAHVRKELKFLNMDIDKFQLYTTHDGAPYMFKAIKLLKSQFAQHCVAHSIHLLIMNDGINKNEELINRVDWLM